MRPKQAQSSPRSPSPATAKSLSERQDGETVANTGRAQRTQDNISTAGKEKRGLSYGRLVKQLAKDYGVSVGAVPPAKANPYSMSTADAEKAMRKAGIHTRSGKLSPLFK